MNELNYLIDEVEDVLNGQGTKDEDEVFFIGETIQLKTDQIKGWMDKLKQIRSTHENVISMLESVGIPDLSDEDQRINVLVSRLQEMQDLDGLDIFLDEDLDLRQVIEKACIATDVAKGLVEGERSEIAQEIHADIKSDVEDIIEQLRTSGILNKNAERELTDYIKWYM